MEQKDALEELKNSFALERILSRTIVKTANKDTQTKKETRHLSLYQFFINAKKIITTIDNTLGVKTETEDNIRLYNFKPKKHVPKRPPVDLLDAYELLYGSEIIQPWLNYHALVQFSNRYISGTIENCIDTLQDWWKLPLGVFSTIAGLTLAGFIGLGSFEEANTLHYITVDSPLMYFLCLETGFSLGYALLLNDKYNKSYGIKITMKPEKNTYSSEEFNRVKNLVSKLNQIEITVPT